MSPVMAHRSEPRETDQPPSKRWTRDEFLRMAEVGLLKPHARVELVEGEILEMSPMNRPHRVAMVKARDALLRVFGDGYYITDQLPLAIGTDTELYPDVAVFQGHIDDSPEEPTGAVLVLEISDTTLQYDRGRKLRLYAAAGVAEYWILDIEGRTLEVRRGPERNPESAEEFGYETLTRCGEEDWVAPLAAPGRSVAVSHLLPRRAKD